MKERYIRVLLSFRTGKIPIHPPQEVDTSHRIYLHGAGGYHGVENVAARTRLVIDTTGHIACNIMKNVLLAL